MLSPCNSWIKPAMGWPPRKAQLGIQHSAIQSARAQLAQAQYNEELTNIRAPVDGKIIRRYANPGAGASTLNVSNMFDLEPALPHIIRAEIVESAIPDVYVGQAAQIIPEVDSSKVWTGHVMRIAATFGSRKLKSDSATEASDERVVEVVVSADNAPFLIGQRVMVKFMKAEQNVRGAQVKFGTRVRSDGTAQNFCPNFTPMVRGWFGTSYFAIAPHSRTSHSA